MGCRYPHSFRSLKWLSGKDPGIPQKERGEKNFELFLPLSLCQQINEWAQYLPWELQMTHHFVILSKLLGSFPAFDFCSRETETSSEQFDNTVAEQALHKFIITPDLLPAHRDGRKSMEKLLCILDSNNYSQCTAKSQTKWRKMKFHAWKIATTFSYYLRFLIFLHNHCYRCSDY